MDVSHYMVLLPDVLLDDITPIVSLGEKHMINSLLPLKHAQKSQHSQIKKKGAFLEWGLTIIHLMILLIL